MSITMKFISAAIVLVAGAGVAYYLIQGKTSNEVETSTMEINFGNNFWKPLKSIELSPAGKSTYTALPLEEGGLGAGNFIKYGIPDGRTVCTYDLRATKDSGEAAEWLGVDLCAATYYHFEDEG